MALSEEEKKIRRREANKRYLEKQKAKKAEENCIKFDDCRVAIPDEQVDWKAEFVAENKRARGLELKIEQYEKLIASFAERENQSKGALQRATLEYNARIKYMLDCVKHAYQSIQFAANAINPEEKGAHYGD
jgi:hypothetical protein